MLMRKATRTRWHCATQIYDIRPTMFQRNCRCEREKVERNNLSKGNWWYFPCQLILPPFILMQLSPINRLPSVCSKCENIIVSLIFFLFFRFRDSAVSRFLFFCFPWRQHLKANSGEISKAQQLKFEMKRHSRSGEIGEEKVEHWSLNMFLCGGGFWFYIIFLHLTCVIMPRRAKKESFSNNKN